MKFKLNKFLVFFACLSISFIFYFAGANKSQALITSANVLWNSLYGSGTVDAAWSVAIDPSGNYIYDAASIGDWQFNYSYKHTYSLILKYDNAGNLIWSKTVDPSCESTSLGIQVDSSSNVYILEGAVENCSSVFTAIDTITNVYLDKYDSSGNFLWQSNDLVPASNQFVSAYLAIDSAGNYTYVDGSSIYNSECEFGFCHKVHNVGFLYKISAASGSVINNRIDESPDHVSYNTGYNCGSGGVTINQNTIYQYVVNSNCSTAGNPAIVAYDTSLSPISSKDLPAGISPSIIVFSSTGSNIYLIGGATSNGWPPSTYLLNMRASDYSTVFYTTHSDMQANGLALDQNGNINIFGFGNNFSSMKLVQYDSSGNLTADINYNSVPSYIDVGNGIVASGPYLYLAGMTIDSSCFYICNPDANFGARTVKILAPVNGSTISVSTNNVSSTWSFPASAGNPCGNCSGTSQTYTGQTTGIYNFLPSSIYANSEVSASSASGGASCSSNTQCNLTASGQINYTATYTPATCTVAVQGYFNGSTQAATNQSFSITGGGSASGTDTNGYQTFTLPADPSGTNYNFVVNSPGNGVSVNNYTSDYQGVNSSSLSCTPNQTIVFQIDYQSRPYLNLH
jgi:hypothetical protein